MISELEEKEKAIPLLGMSIDELRRHVRSADVIRGWDLDTSNLNLFYGRKSLNRIIKTGKTKRLKMITFQYDQRTDQLEILCAAINVEKGKHDYEGSEDQQ